MSHRYLDALASATRALGLFALALLSACHDSSSGGGGGGGVPENEAEFLAHWNRVAVDASGLDHAPTDATHIRGEQIGPCRSARAMAIVHLAIFEVVNAIRGGYESRVGLPSADPNTSLRAAIAQATCDSLMALFPSQETRAARFTTALSDDLANVAAGAAKTQGIALGQAAAAAVLASRAGDGSDHPEPSVGTGPDDYHLVPGPGKWRQDPISNLQVALGANWSQVTPFSFANANQFRAPDPPALDSAEYTLAYQEAQVLGGDGVITPTARPDAATIIGTYWAYDGTPSLCAPPRLYNQIALQIAKERGTNVVDMARLLVLVNVAMCDAGIACWESKYHFAFWRPVTGIRHEDDDGNASTVADMTYTPLGAPASNSLDPDFTPPFPAYPSGHATFGGALFETLRLFYGTDEIEFTFVSDEYNGVTEDVLGSGNPRPLLPRTFSSLSAAEEENGQSRIYLGIHWMFDKTAGIAMGRLVANHVFDNFLVAVP